ncbi:MAG: roadblock/LC7 domain-containing protein [Candidatus Lokiarchaeota archaeon]|nr:roadblock/LC7 domain-containing protein [Candidatus Lokiarchaeota archaeon]
MHLKEKIGIHLDQIKQLKGVENAVLTQRDGNPIQSTGVWFSKDEIFNVSSATSAIFNVGIHLHPNDLKYILIEGKKAKILIAPLNSPLHHSLNRILEQQGILDNNHEFFIAITAQPNVNLGGIFLQTSECLKKIKTTLITSGESFKPPLIQFTTQKIQNIIEGFKVKENEEFNLRLSSFSLSFSENISIELRKILNNFSLTIPDLKYAFITIEGGFIVSKLLKKFDVNKEKLDNISAMSYSLFQTANRCAWLLKKMQAENILLDCENTFQFINGLGKAIFSTEIGKVRQKLGLIRLILPQFSKKINTLIKQASEIQDHRTFDIKRLLGELIIK